MLGLGTWHMAEDSDRREDELGALREGLDHGLAIPEDHPLYAGIVGIQTSQQYAN